mgnify:CR=1 FL=1
MEKKLFIDILKHILPNVLLGDIYKYAIYLHFQKWIPVDKINKHNLARFWTYRPSHAHDPILKNLDKIDWDRVSYGCCEASLELLKHNTDKINWTNLADSSYDSAILMIRNHFKFKPYRINWSRITDGRCKEAVRLLESYPRYIDWRSLSAGNCKEAVQLLKRNIDKIEWNQLSSSEFIYDHGYRLF